MRDAIRTTIDSAGRVVVPKELRDQARLRPGQVLEVRFRDGAIELTPAPLPVRIVKKGHFSVAVPEIEVEPLTEEIVHEALRQLREHDDQL